MGLLTDPGAGRGKFSQYLVHYHSRLCLLMYLGCIVWFLLLVYEPYNAGTYFSENALLPGLVKGEFNDKHVAKGLYEELKTEAERYPNDMPYTWLRSKMRQIGLDVYSHEYSLNYPMGLGVNYTGKNIYGIIRAPRGASTEALVLSVPYRPLASANLGTLPGVALSLSLAKYFRRQKYWAKDIIFLYTQHEQLGVQAWLEAYHQVSCGKGILQHNDLKGRSGAIQAAINLELYGEVISHLNVKIEGLNGQLPNLDLVNLVHRMSSKENVRHTFHNEESWEGYITFKSYLRSLKTLMSMVTTQAAGVPNGNHGLFLRFGISAVTIEGFENKERQYGPGFYQVGRIMEGVFRSLNNLLERFHQSFFFYLLPSNNRYISIGLYMPCICLLAGSLLIRAFAMWLKLNESIQDESSGIATDWPAVVQNIGVSWIAIHLLGFVLVSGTETFSRLGLEFGLMTVDSISFAYFAFSALSLLLPFLLRLYKINMTSSAPLLHILTLLEFSVAMVAVGMHNISLALLTGVLFTPVALFIDAYSTNSVKKFALRLLMLVLHPIVLLSIAVTVTAASAFAWENLTIAMIFDAMKQSIMFSTMDRYIYGNWIMTAGCVILFPVWMILWCILNCAPPPSKEQKAKAE
ncbi:glycosylphosphatidylinositol anchor attachment 1 protein [Neocloeon triangulifer]|uniref:glycosylphosphatidylinositol anchor attachment 1 protein n=1 Tax=Neocloeon triangulifer TaxID=2078957 RepID=UPI00286F6D9B|nr:glycosylphosphatidylinositol anchor attachment 1 protein [Neocloeon triangulifer]